MLMTRSTPLLVNAPPSSASGARDTANNGTPASPFDAARSTFHGTCLGRRSATPEHQAEYATLDCRGNASGQGKQPLLPSHAFNVESLDRLRHLRIERRRGLGNGGIAVAMPQAFGACAKPRARVRELAAAVTEFRHALAVSFVYRDRVPVIHNDHVAVRRGISLRSGFRVHECLRDGDVVLAIFNEHRTRSPVTSLKFR